MPLTSILDNEVRAITAEIVQRHNGFVFEGIFSESFL